MKKRRCNRNVRRLVISAVILFGALGACTHVLIQGELGFAFSTPPCQDIPLKSTALDAAEELAYSLTLADQPDFVDELLDSTVVISVKRLAATGTKEFNGTGFLIADDLIVTAAHVLRDAVSVEVRLRYLKKDRKTIGTGPAVSATIVGLVRHKDIGLLQIREDMPLFGEPLRIDCSWNPGLGRPVWHLGNTSGWSFGRIDMVRHITIINSTKIDQTVRFLANCDYGDSGGPVLTPYGKVIGHVIATDKTNKDKTYFIPIRDALDALEDLVTTVKP